MPRPIRDSMMMMMTSVAVFSIAVIMADKKSKSAGVKRVLTKKEQEEIKKKVCI